MGTMYPRPGFEGYAAEMRRQAMLNSQANPDQKFIWNRNTGAYVEHESTPPASDQSTTETPVAPPPLPLPHDESNDDWFEWGALCAVVVLGIVMAILNVWR